MCSTRTCTAVFQNLSGGVALWCHAQLCGTTTQSRHAVRIQFHVWERPTNTRGRNSTRMWRIRHVARPNADCTGNPCTHVCRQTTGVAVPSAVGSRCVCVVSVSMVRTSSRIACADIEACTRQMHRLVFRTSALSYHNIRIFPVIPSTYRHVCTSPAQDAAATKLAPI